MRLNSVCSLGLSIGRAGLVEVECCLTILRIASISLSFLCLSPFRILALYEIISPRIPALTVCHRTDGDVESDLLFSIKHETFSEINSQNLADDDSSALNLQFEWLLVLWTSPKYNRRGAWPEMTVDEYSHT